MKKSILLALFILTFLGSGCDDSEQKINLQQDKELKIIEAQKQKEIEVIKFQQDIQRREERIKQTKINDCLENAKRKNRETVDILLRFRGLNDKAGVTGMEQVVNDLNKACKNNFPNDITGCLKMDAEYISEASNERKSEEAKCYTRF